MIVSITSALLNQLIDQAERSPNREICGLLFGTPCEIRSAAPAANVAQETATSFEVDPAVLLAAHRAQRNGGPLLIGNYHSHPSGRPDPSPRDAAAALPGQLWLILARGGAALYQAGAGAAFRRVELVVR